MAVISFRRPEEGLDYYKHVLDLFTIFADVARNPDAGKNISDLSKQVNDALAISEAKKKELAEAQDIIAQANEFVEEFNKRQTEYEAKVKADEAASLERDKRHQENLKSFDNEKKAFQAQVAKEKADTLNKLSAAQARATQAEQIEKSANLKLSEIKEREATHAKNVAELEKTKTELAAQKTAHEAEHQQKMAKLEQERKDFEEYRSNLMSMLTKGK